MSYRIVVVDEDTGKTQEFRYEECDVQTDVLMVQSSGDQQPEVCHRALRITAWTETPRS